jgi:hypothetical protein
MPVSRILPLAMGVEIEPLDEDRPPTVYLEGRNDEPWQAMPWITTP